MLENKRSVTVNGVEYPIVLAKINGKFMKRICVNKQLHICVMKKDEEYFLNGSTNINYTAWEEIKDLPPEDEYRPYTPDEAIKFIGTFAIDNNEAIRMITAFYPDTEEIRVDLVIKNLHMMLQQYRHYEPGRTFEESDVFGVKL